MNYAFYTLDVFTDRPFGGNPLAVFPDAQGLSSRLMQQIAREFNLSETVFVLPPDHSAHACRLRIFTPTTEIPFAGHPTVGTAFLLAHLGRIPLGDSLVMDSSVTDSSVMDSTVTVVFEEGVGSLSVSIQAIARQPRLTQFAAPIMPLFGPEPPSREAIASLLSLEPTDLLEGGWSPQAVSCGLPFLFVPLGDRHALQRATLNWQEWQPILSSFWAPHVYVFCPDAEGVDAHWRARMFAPALGIGEDPATGSAATAFAGYLSLREPQPNGTWHWVIEQGFEMGRPSLIHLSLQKQDGKPSAIWVGGTSVIVSHGHLHIPLDPEQTQAPSSESP